MTFEEDFPSLKGKASRWEGDWDVEKKKPINRIFFELKVIHKFCLDKSKVKQAIEELKERCSHSHHVNKVRLLINVLNELIRELGL